MREKPADVTACGARYVAGSEVIAIPDFSAEGDGAHFIEISDHGASAIGTATQTIGPTG